MKSHNSGTTTVVTITSTPTLIKAYDPDNVSRIDLSIINMSNQTIYYGYDSSITTTTGWPLYVDEKENETGYHGNVYGIVASGTAEVRVRYK